MKYWHPVLAHRGAGGPPWFAIDNDGLVRRFAGHPMGASAVPSFYVVGGSAYTTGDDETKFCAPGVPWFRITGSMITPGDGHPDSNACVTLYQQRDDVDLTLAHTETSEALMSREADILSACVEFADTCGEDYDIVESAERLAHRCVELIDCTEAGIMLADRDGTLCYVASSSDRIRLVEVVELELNEGPNVFAFEHGVAAHRVTGDGANEDCPRFASHARNAGFASVSAVPMRLRSETIGTLSLYSATAEPLDATEQAIAQALANIATIGILQQRALGDGRVVVSQLETALESRVVIEQAKGILAERLGVSVDVAFKLLRRDARNRNASLRILAAAVVSKSLTADELTKETRPRVASPL